jgi:hypothetical protein
MTGMLSLPNIDRLYIFSQSNFLSIRPKEIIYKCNALILNKPRGIWNYLVFAVASFLGEFWNLNKVVTLVYKRQQDGTALTFIYVLDLSPFNTFQSIDMFLLIKFHIKNCSAMCTAECGHFLHFLEHYPFKRQIKSHLPFASITRRCNYSSR